MCFGFVKIHIDGANVGDPGGLHFNPVDVGNLYYGRGNVFYCSERKASTTIRWSRLVVME